MNQMTPLTLFLAYAVLIFVAMYLFIYIPNKKKQRKMQELHNSLKPGDKVVTVGGIVAAIKEREGDYVTLIVDEEQQTTMKVVIYAVNQIVKQEG